jgi:DNA-binding protein YbaB
MFDQMKQAAKLASMLKDLPKLKSRMEQVKAELAGSTVDGVSGGGAVVAVVTGQLRVVSIECGPAMVVGLADPASRVYAQTLIAEAVNDGMGKAQAMIAAAVHEAAQEMDLPIPEGMLDGLLR